MMHRAGLEFYLHNDETLTVRIEGDWVIGNPIFSAKQAEAYIKPPIESVKFDTEALLNWDSRFVNFITKISENCTAKNITIDFHGLPSGVQSLIKLAKAVPYSAEVKQKFNNPSFLMKIGDRVRRAGHETKQMIEFLGDLFLASIIFFRGKARYRPIDLGITLEECGPRALPIVTLISVLVGLILAFIGAIQLNTFGAQIYVANLVGLGMTREMGAMMTAVIMAGRTGAAFAAQLGTMQVNEEIDALKTMGISPIEFLVLPRALGLILMLPLLCLYADFMGILGGFIVGVGLLDLTMVEYYHQTEAALGLNDFAVGFIKSIIFGVLVAFSGCLRGLQCGRSSAAVGAAATSAVVTSIVAIVVADAIMTLVYDALGI